MRRMLAAAAVLSLTLGCATLRQFMALEQVRFDLHRVADLRLAGIDLARARQFSSLTPSDALTLGAAIARGDLPLEFTTVVRAENPGDAAVTARMVRFAWTLYLDDVETVHGALNEEVPLPPGSPQLIPIVMTLNLLDYFDDSAKTLFDLAVALLDPEADPVTISLHALPTIETPLGPIAYPEPIRIVKRSVGGTP